MDKSGKAIGASCDIEALGRRAQAKSQCADARRDAEKGLLPARRDKGRAEQTKAKANATHYRSSRAKSSTFRTRATFASLDTRAPVGSFAGHFAIYVRYKCAHRTRKDRDCNIADSVHSSLSCFFHSALVANRKRYGSSMNGMNATANGTLQASMQAASVILRGLLFSLRFRGRLKGIHVLYAFYGCACVLWLSAKCDNI